MIKKLDPLKKAKSKNGILTEKDSELGKKIQNLEIRFNGRIEKVEEGIVKLSEKLDQILSCIRNNS
jgi:hypothetical protein